MVLVIPMSGAGKRFQAAGYAEVKPLLTIEGRPTIAHVLDMFPGEEDVVFICNKDHLKNTEMRDVLLGLRPKAKIIPIEAHNHGPVWAIKQAFDSIPDDEDVLISYCDYTGLWDYEAFKEAVKDVDGAIPAYIGFHPHLLGPNLYGHMRWDENNHMIEMQEKHAFTDDKMQEYGAVGSYWFRSGELMKKYFSEALENELRTGTEFFCSMPYNYLVRDGGKVLIFDMDKFCQWGTPEDLEEYEAWSRKIAGGEKGLTKIPADREENVVFRDTSPENLALTEEYWKEFFADVDWHPYNGA